MSKIRTCLWYDDNGEEAARMYCALLPDSRIETVVRPDPEGPASIVDFVLAGTPYQALSGGPRFTLNEAASIQVLTDDQAETDRLWNALTADGGREMACAWLTDRFGLSWQIVPREMLRLISDRDDPEAAARAHEAMLKMKKIDIEALRAAHRGA